MQSYVIFPPSGPHEPKRIMLGGNWIASETKECSFHIFWAFSSGLVNTCDTAPSSYMSGLSLTPASLIVWFIAHVIVSQRKRRSKGRDTDHNPSAASEVPAGLEFHPLGCEVRSERSEKGSQSLANRRGKKWFFAMRDGARAWKQSLHFIDIKRKYRLQLKRL